MTEAHDETWDDEEEEAGVLSLEQQIILARQAQARLSREEWLVNELGDQHEVILDALQEYAEHREQQRQERCAECGSLAEYQVWLCAKHAGVLGELEEEILAHLKRQEDAAVVYPQVILARADGRRCRLMKEYQSSSLVLTDSRSCYWEYREMLPDNIHFAPGSLQIYQEVERAVSAALGNKYTKLVQF